MEQNELLEEYKAKMQDTLDHFDGNEEDGHIEADELLCELLIRLGFEEVIDIYNQMDKWYS